MIVCSFDPSSSKNLGFATLCLNEKDDTIESSAGTYILPKTEERWQMLWPLFQIVDAALAENNPDLVVIEQTGAFSASFITSQIGNCIGVILAVCGKHQVPVTYQYPSHVKKCITGAGKATKAKMKKCVRKILLEFGCNVKFDSEHAYDATANILCWLFDQKIMLNPLTNSDPDGEEKDGK